jgi:hypothetical protein
MNTKVTRGNYPQPEPHAMHAIIIIKYRDRPAKSEHSWKTLLQRTKVSLLSDANGRAVLHIQGDSDGLSIALRMIWTEFAGDLEEAVRFDLSDQNFRVGPDTPQGLADSYLIPDITP